jgi:predicted nucleotidyltransferase
LATSSAALAALTEDQVRKIRALGERLGVRNIRLVGSFARRDARPDSDLDLVVDYVPGHGGFAFIEFCQQVEELIGRKVDVVTEKSLHLIIRDRILAQAVPL